MLGNVPSPNPTAQACAGRVKTLHPGVHGGILARRDLPGHLAALDQHGIALIDLVRPQRSGFILCGDMWGDVTLFELPCNGLWPLRAAHDQARSGTKGGLYMRL